MAQQTTVAVRKQNIILHGSNDFDSMLSSVIGNSGRHPYTEDDIRLHGCEQLDGRCTIPDVYHERSRHTLTLEH